MLSHQLRRVERTEAPNISLVHTTSSVSVNNDTWTVSGASFGDRPGGSSTRHLIAAFTFFDNDDSDFFFSASCTIGGVAANAAIELGIGTADTNTAGIAFFTIENNTDLTGDVVLTISNFSGTMDAYGLALYRVIGLNSETPTTTPTGTINITLVVPTNGFGIAAAVRYDDTQAIGSFTGSDAVTAYSGTQAGAVMSRTVAGSVAHDSANANLFRGATWSFIST